MPLPTTIESLQHQLDRLHHEHRRTRTQLRLLVAALAGGAGILAIAGWQDPKDELVLKKLTLADGTGKTAHFDAESFGFLDKESPKLVVNTEDGEGNIVMFDRKAKARLVFGASPEGAVLSMMDEAGVNRIVMTQQGTEAALRIDAPAGKGAVLIAGTDKGSLVSLQDAKDETRISLGLMENSPVGLFLHDSKGNLRTGLIADDNEQVLGFYDAAEKLIKSYGPKGG